MIVVLTHAPCAPSTDHVIRVVLLRRLTRRRILDARLARLVVYRHSGRLFRQSVRNARQDLPDEQAQTRPGDDCPGGEDERGRSAAFAPCQHIIVTASGGIKTGAAFSAPLPVARITRPAVRTDSFYFRHTLFYHTNNVPSGLHALYNDARYPIYRSDRFLTVVGDRQSAVVTAPSFRLPVFLDSRRTG